MSQETLDKLHCPACDAPLEYDGKSTTVKCPYCKTNFVVPEEWRTPVQPAPAAHADDDDDTMREIAALARSGNQLAAIKLMRQTYNMSLHEAKDAVDAMAMGGYTRTPQVVVARLGAASGMAETLAYAPEVRRRSGGCLSFAVWLIIITFVIIGVIFYTRTVRTTAITTVVNEVTTALPDVKMPASAASLLQTLNGSFATEVMRFGSAGIGPGKFTDARAIAVDSAGHIFVGEYESGLVQVFDRAGKFLTVWTLPEHPLVGQFAAARDGLLYIVYAGNVTIHDGMTGEVVNTLPRLTNGSRGEYQDSVALGADGSVYAVWGGDIVRLDRNLQPNLRIGNAIENALNQVETTTILAVNGVGDIYALGESTDAVVKFASDGRFVNQFGGSSGEQDGPARLQAASAIATDSQGRVYVGDIAGVKVYSPNGQYIDSIGFSGYPFGIAIDDQDNLYLTNRTEVIKYKLPS